MKQRLAIGSFLVAAALVVVAVTLLVRYRKAQPTA